MCQYCFLVTFKILLEKMHQNISPLMQQQFLDEVMAGKEDKSLLHTQIWDKIAANCRAEMPRPAHPDLKCEHISFQDAYLKLGPFKLEQHYTGKAWHIRLIID